MTDKIDKNLSYFFPSNCCVCLRNCWQLQVSRLDVSMQRIHNPSGFSPSTMISYSQTKDMKETYIPRLNMDLTLRIFLHSPNICRKSRLSPLSELVYAGFLACSPDSYISRCGHSLSAHVSLEDTVIGSYRGVRATNQTGKKEWVLAVDGRVNPVK